MLGKQANMPPNEQAMQGKNFRLSVKVTVALLVLLSVGMLFEAAARFVYVYRETIQGYPPFSGMLQQGLHLDPYEMPSPGGRYHWILRPGYQATEELLVAEKKRAGRDFGARVLQGEIENRESDGKTLFRINADGFKGPELDRSHSRPRILALGDSTTFGAGAGDYPSVISKVLNERGIPTEVINGGVEGYFLRNIYFEMERYKSLKPEIVTLYVGWNDLFFNVPWDDALENLFRSVWLIDRASRAAKAIFGGRRAYAEKMYNRELKPDPVSPEVKRLNRYVPLFLDRIENVVEEFESIGSQVLLVTLPGLFNVSTSPSPRALKIGHLPYYTKNPYVLAKLTERYNAALRGLAAKRHIQVIDLEKWGTQALKPKDAHFVDSVHLTGRGLEKIGSYMADQLANHLKKLPREGG